jgi:hypothetical protein
MLACDGVQLDNIGIFSPAACTTVRENRPPACVNNVLEVGGTHTPTKVNHPTNHFINWLETVPRTSGNIYVYCTRFFQLLFSKIKKKKI